MTYNVFSGTLNPTHFTSRGIGRVNRMAVLSRDKTDVSRRNDRRKRIADRYLKRMTLKVGHVWNPGR